MKYRCIFLMLVSSFFLSVVHGEETLHPRVVYGQDDRMEFLRFVEQDGRDFWKKRGRAVVGLFGHGDIKYRPDAEYSSLKYQDITLGQVRNLCDGQKFADQPTGPFCTGFLVKPNKIVTAGHCIETDFQCSRTYFAFGFKAKDDGSVSNKLKSKNIYHCKELIRSKVTDGKDFAVIKLDRKVKGRQPLRFRRSNKRDPLVAGDSLLVMGHPSGLPLKVADKGTILENVDPDSDEYFVATLDTFGGNSGSPVFNDNPDSPHFGKVEGILVRGATDYTWNADRTCQVVNACAEDGSDCTGEDSTRIRFIRRWIQKKDRHRLR